MDNNITIETKWVFSWITNILKYWKKKLDSNINIWVFNYKINWVYDKNSSIVNKYLTQIDNKFSRTIISKKYTIILSFINIDWDDILRDKINEAREKKVDYFLYWEITSKWDDFEVINEFRSINDNDFVKNNIEWDKLYSKINIYDKCIFLINKEEIEISTLIDNIKPLIELNYSSNESNFIKNLWLDNSSDLNNSRYSWYLSLWKALDWIKKFELKKDELDENKKNNLLSLIESNLLVAKDEAEKKYFPIINNEIIKFFSLFDDEKKYKKLIRVCFNQNIEILKWTEDYTEEIFSYFHYRFINFMNINNPLSLLSLESELDDFYLRWWLNWKQKIYYYFYKSKFTYSKFLLSKIDYITFINELEEIYINFLELIISEEIIWNKYYIYRRIINLINYNYISFESIKLLFKSIQLKKHINEKEYKNNELNIYFNKFLEDESLIFITYFIDFLENGDFWLKSIEIYFKNESENKSKKIFILKDSSEIKKHKKKIDLLNSRINSVNEDMSIDLYESKNFDYIYFWLIRYNKINTLRINIIDKLLNNKKANLVDLYNVLLFLLNNNEINKFNTAIGLIKKEYEKLLSWLEDSFILYWISLLFYEYKNSIKKDDIHKNNILYIIVVLSQFMPQLWTPHFENKIYNIFIKNNTNDLFKNEVNQIFNYIKSVEKNKYINLIDSKNNYSLFLDTNKFTINKISILKKIYYKLKW